MYSEIEIILRRLFEEEYILEEMMKDHDYGYADILSIDRQNNLVITGTYLMSELDH